ncbi:MAG: PLP-dependent aminotransferase family protein [Clostridia bacterium]|nr:PLP-dependent aminotransferase family protein [Clostridia bacterium]
MKYIIDNEINIPAYLQLYRQVRDDIVKGIFPCGSKLPSKRIIADELGISTVTVEHAYALLGDEGYIESKERSGYFVSFQLDDGFAVSANAEMHHIQYTYHQECSTFVEFPFSVLTKTMRRVMSDLGESILARSPNTGCTELREEISRYLARSRGVRAEAEQIIIGSGSEYLYGLIVELLGRNKRYAIESPSYKKIEQVYRASDVQLEKLPLGHDGIDSSSLRRCKADVLHISPYRSYPSGVTATASKRHEYLRWAGQGERFIVEDDFESEFSLSQKAEETLFSHTSKDNVIYMNTFSKTISPSFRVGYMVLPECLAKTFNERLGFYSCTVPTYIQFVLAELISNGDFERHINRVRRAKRKESDKLIKP